MILTCDEKVRRYTDEEYLLYDPLGGYEEPEVSNHTTKLVTTRVDHTCQGTDNESHGHLIPRGSRARFEKALVDGRWCSYYLCLDCMDRWLAG